MDENFQSLIDGLPDAFDRLISMKPEQASTLPPNAPTKGVYILSEGPKHLYYVGRSNCLPKRVCNHGAPGATDKQAAFAFRLAREATGNTKATYRTKGSRPDLMKDPAFKAAFEKAKARIAKMPVRYVAEPDPWRQCLLEIYVAAALKTPHNNFDTH